MNRLFRKSDNEEHNFWMSYTDLMSGFLAVFIIIAIITYNKFQTESERNKGSLTEINKDFKDIFDKIDDVTIDESSNSIRFYAPNKEMLFQPGESKMEANLKNRIKTIGKPFVERAMDLKMNQNKNIQEIRIEGHTDSNPIPGKEPFMGNLDLSSKRAYVIYEFIHDSCGLTNQQKQFVEEYMISVGYSYAHRLPSNENENRDKSRRIEFRIISK